MQLSYRVRMILYNILLFAFSFLIVVFCVFQGTSYYYINQAKDNLLEMSQDTTLYIGQELKKSPKSASLKDGLVSNALYLSKGIAVSENNRVLLFDTSLDALEQELNKLMEDKDAFYIFKIDGTFNTIKARSVPIQEKPYPILSEAVKSQSIFDYTNITGSLIGFWCPEYIGGVNVPGYHFHFISQDRTKGGHLLDISFDQAEVFKDSTDGFSMTLSPTTPEGSVEDVNSEINAVEK